MSASEAKTRNRIETLVSSARNAFASGKTLPLEFRLAQLRQLLRLYEENNDEILGALKLDMRKSALEGYLYELDLAKNEVRNAIRNLSVWIQPKWLKRNLLMMNDAACKVRVPLGTVLILGPWNYPIQLTLVPVAGAIAAGNTCIIKPSEISSHASNIIAELIPRYLDRQCYQVFEGGPAETRLLLEYQFDHVFYTGGIGVGKLVHQACNKYLTPCTLELGGKSPVYVDDTAYIPYTARRIMWGKCMNMGQTCIAPDYILCDRAVEQELIKEIKNSLLEWYGTDLKQATDLSRIGNRKHFEKLKRMLEGAKVAVGGGVDENELWIEPSVLVDVQESDPVMQEEIFGPIVPIIRCNSPAEALKFINRRPRPLCLYVFSDNRTVADKLITGSRSGTVCVNDTIVQFGIDELPFGGVGESGIGSYHGKYTFKAFSHQKSIVYRDFSWIGDQVGIFRYPPYNKVKIEFLSFLLCHWKKFKIVWADYVWYLIVFLCGILVAKYYM